MLVVLLCTVSSFHMSGQYPKRPCAAGGGRPCRRRLSLRYVRGCEEQLSDRLERLWEGSKCLRLRGQSLTDCFVLSAALLKLQQASAGARWPRLRPPVRPSVPPIRLLPCASADPPPHPPQRRELSPAELLVLAQLFTDGEIWEAADDDGACTGRGGRRPGLGLRAFTAAS